MAYFIFILLDAKKILLSTKQKILLFPAKSIMEILVYFDAIKPTVMFSKAKPYRFFYVRKDIVAVPFAFKPIKKTKSNTIKN
ncbi:hypothetical protein DLK05_13985 [Ancylomarina longa]|uniref:Uncharacterized protein n=1 Tax=Ancylomarina longa TaxID=2487017 RepID=A0A434AFY7_9BACT|nr:hypothetical protein DLK05_13985 [Ancylomarina longa]